MKFIISQDGTITVNSLFIRTIYIEEESISYKEDFHTVVNVKAELKSDTNEFKPNYSDYVVTLATFYSGNLEEDYKSSQAYLAKLVAEINGGTK